MRLYSTLSRRKEELKPLNPGELSLYTCGPTVYLEPHIGNWRSFIFHDVLARALRLADYKVKHVMNITDVGHLVSDADEGEDKIQKEADLERKTAWEVAEHYADLFKQGMEKLNLQTPWQMPKATDHIPEQIALVKKLEQKGLTYRIDDGIYFDTSKFPDYGKLAGLDRDAQMAGARVDANPQKKHHTDFALWKFSPQKQKRDMEWDSPWGKGFPGWHLECSAMAMQYLGESIDLHGGGVDHIGVHHTNEIAQSEAATGQPFARIWYHVEFLMVDGQKVAKSLGNYIYLSDVAQKADLMAFRLMILMSHYRSQQNFTWEALEAAQQFLLRLYGLADRQLQLHENGSREAETKLNQAVQRFKEAVQDDLNTPGALAVIGRLIDELDSLVIDNPQPFRETLETFERVLGLGLTERKDISPEQKSQIQTREAARQRQDFTAADKIRNELKSKGLEIEDTPHGPRWHRTLV